MDAIDAQVFQVRRRLFPKAAPKAKWDTWRQVRLGWRLAFRRTGMVSYAVEALTIFALGALFGVVLVVTALSGLTQP